MIVDRVLHPDESDYILPPIETITVREQQANNSILSVVEMGVLLQGRGQFALFSSIAAPKLFKKKSSS